MDEKLMKILKWIDKRIIWLEAKKKATPNVDKKINFGVKARGYKEIQYELKKLEK